MLTVNKLGALGLLISDIMEHALGDVSRSAAALLLTLHYSPSITATELADVAGVTQPTATRVLDGLERRGWLKRQVRSGRTTPLRLTSAGQRKARSLQAARLQALDGLLVALPKQERAAFERTIAKLLAAATTSRAFARTTCRLCDHGVCDGPLCPIGTRASELERKAGKFNQPEDRQF